jgi:hypothetical protein
MSSIAGNKILKIHSGEMLIVYILASKLRFMKKLYLSLLFIIILVYGCKKDGKNPAVHLLIASQNITDYYPGDSTLTYQKTMQYDNMNRLTSVTYNYGARYYLAYQYYSYDANSDIIKMTDVEGTTDTTEVVTYDYQDGIPVSTYYSAEGSANPVLEATYTVSKNKVTGTTFTNSGNPATETITYNGNNYNAFTYDNGTTYTYTYGTHISPYLYTGFKYCLDYLSYVINDNEILEEKVAYNTGQVEDYKYNYTYNSQGYPVTEQYTNGGTLEATVTFSYISAK